MPLHAQEVLELANYNRPIGSYAEPALFDIPLLDILNAHGCFHRISLSLSSGNERSETKSASPRSSTAGATDDGHASAPSSLETPANGTEDTADKTQKQQQQPQTAASATVAASPAAATDEKLIPAGKKRAKRKNEPAAKAAKTQGANVSKTQAATDTVTELPQGTGCIVDCGCFDGGAIGAELGSHVTEWIKKRVPKQFWPVHKRRGTVGSKSYCINSDCGSRLEINWTQQFVRMEISCEGPVRFTHLWQQVNAGICACCDKNYCPRSVVVAREASDPAQ